LLVPILALTATLGSAGPLSAQTLWPSVGPYAVTQAPDQGAPATSAEAPGLSDGAKQGIGCLITGGAALTWGYLAGPSELIMVAAGGVLAPSATAPLTIALLGTLGASSCALGAMATPTALWAYDEWDHITATLTRQAAGAAVTVTALARQWLEGAQTGSRTTTPTDGNPHQVAAVP